jgi:hypothetical protein
VSAEPRLFYKVRSLVTWRFLQGSRGFYGSSTTYDTKTGAKCGYTHYKERNTWQGTDRAEIVEFTATETSTEELT